MNLRLPAARLTVGAKACGTARARWRLPLIPRLGRTDELRARRRADDGAVGQLESLTRCCICASVPAPVPELVRSAFRGLPLWPGMAVSSLSSSPAGRVVAGDGCGTGDQPR